MTYIKFLISTFLIVLFFGCGPEKNHDFSIKTNTNKGKIRKNEALTLSINNPKELNIESVSYKLNGTKVESNAELSKYQLGTYMLTAAVTYDGLTTTISSPITIINNVAPKIYTYEIINTYPHEITSYTQGLEFHNGILYESTGQYGASKLRKVDYKTGAVLKNINLDKAYFGEGLTIMNQNIYQLTWQKGIGFVYNLDTFDKKSTFKYNQSKQGWGLCNDGKVIYKTDGTEKIWILNPETLAEERYIEAYTNKGKMNQINELEWVNGKIYANRYQKDGVAIINPDNGAIEGVIDFSPLKKKVTQHKKLDVLNGLAWNNETQTLFVTGKHWDKLFEVKIIEK
ncbi:MAG: glutaminyl-peptide cyclotransferase [Flavobacteriaceae bacterium]|nr:glutaminyl-peptide cyclotransferase [Flavobacteriaceae bacterium]